jgi:signal recognition particle subunit SEC65
MHKISRGKQHRLIEAARELGLNAKFFVTIQQRYPSRFEYISNKHENLVTAYTLYLLEVDKTRAAMLEFIKQNQGRLEYLSETMGKTKSYLSNIKSTLIKGREISHSQFMTYKRILDENQNTTI